MTKGDGFAMKPDELVGRRFRMDIGDGDQTIFNDEPSVLEVVDRDWFVTPFLNGEAVLLLGGDGPLRGQYIALTSRVVATIAEQAAVRNWISVVVHRLRNTRSGFDPGNGDAIAVGMAAVELLAGQEAGRS